MAGPLGHIRVLDLSRVLAGPWSSMTLADLGAEVIKIEPPERGDDTRTWGPPFTRTADGETGDAAYFLCANRGKKSVTIDFARAEGQRLIRSLAKRCDVLIENFKFGGLARYGLDYPSLRLVNPALVYCSITGFGQTGPYRQRAGYDFMIQGMSGLMSITGAADGVPGAGPIKVGVAVSDILCGLYATIAVLAALAHRDRSGRGQAIDLALLDVQVAALANQALNYLVAGRPPGRLGNAHPNIVPYEVFAAADGHFILAVGNDGQFVRFCEIAGIAELADDPRFATNPARVEFRETLIPILAGIIASRSREDWLRALDAAGVPCGPINDIAQVFADQQVQARHLRIDLPVSGGGTVPSVACPINFSATPVTYERAPPRLGEDTDGVLKDLLSLPDDEVERLRRIGVI